MLFNFYYKKYLQVISIEFKSLIINNNNYYFLYLIHKIITDKPQWLEIISILKIIPLSISK